MVLRRRSIAICVSLAGHGLLLFLLSRSHPNPQLTPRQPSQIAIEFDTRESIREPPAPWTQPEPIRPQADSSSAVRRRPQHPGIVSKTGKREVGPVDRSGTDSRRAPIASGTLEPNSGRGSDTPRRKLLVPDFDTTRGWSLRMPRPESHGQTTRGPDEVFDKDVLKEVEAERVKSRVDGWLDDDRATGRVERGLVDTYFGSVRQALEAATANPPHFKPQLFQSLLRDWASAAQAYGSSGSHSSPERGRPGEQSPLGTAREDKPGTPLDDFGRTLDRGAALRSFADDGRVRMLAIVEIRQARNGRVKQTLLLQSSGNPAFDAHVLRAGPTAIDGLPEAPARGAGIHADGMRTAWAFEGRVVYRKKVHEIELGKDWWYFLAAAPAALATGSFDETTGDVYVVDLHDPKFVCRVKLLRVY